MAQVLTQLVPLASHLSIHAFTLFPSSIHIPKDILIFILMSIPDIISADLFHILFSLGRFRVHLLVIVMVAFLGFLSTPAHILLHLIFKSLIILVAKSEVVLQRQRWDFDSLPTVLLRKLLLVAFHFFSVLVYQVFELAVLSLVLLNGLVR